MKNKELLREIERLEGKLESATELYEMYRDAAINLRMELGRLRGECGCEGKYGTYEELSKLYEDSHENYLALSKILDTAVGKLAYQNMMLEKAREAYKYIIEGDNE